MNALKLSSVAILIVACAAFVGLGSAATAAPGKPTKTKITIQARPGGLSGHVASSDAERCAGNRRVVVFQQEGRSPDRDDKRIGSDRSGGKDAGYRWSVETTEEGRFYARVEGKPGCAAALSKTVNSQPGDGAPGGGAPSGGERTAYPPCSPYTSEGVSSICRLDQFHLELQAEGAGKSCRFGNPSGNCPGVASAGQFPWGETGLGSRPTVRVLWEPGPDRRILTVFSFRPGQPNTILARLSGSVPNAGSPRFTVDEGYAQNEKGFPNGDYFYTPNLPGQGPGEPGGPLAINFQNEGGARGGAQVDITGYLYLRQ